MYIRFQVALSERRRQSLVREEGCGVYCNLSWRRHDARNEITQPPPTPPPLSVVVVHVIPWIQLGKGGGSGCWVLFYHHSNPSIARGRMDRNECKSGITTIYSYLTAEILCDIAPGDAKYM
jgi:hypothetical protein